jgi:hypothetical protein
MIIFSLFFANFIVLDYLCNVLGEQTSVQDVSLIGKQVKVLYSPAAVSSIYRVTLPLQDFEYRVLREGVAQRNKSENLPGQCNDRQTTRMDADTD